MNSLLRAFRARHRAARLVLAVALTVGLAASASAEPPLKKTEIRYQGWAGQVTFIKLADDLGYLAPLKLKWVGNTISGPQGAVPKGIACKVCPLRCIANNLL